MENKILGFRNLQEKFKNYYFLKNFDQLWGKGEEGGEGSKGTIHALHFIPLPTSAQCRTVQ